MAHKRKLQKMQAEEAAASMADEEPPVSELGGAPSDTAEFCVMDLK